MKTARRDWLSLEEVARQIRVHRTTLHRAAAAMECDGTPWAPLLLGPEAPKVLLKTRRVAGGRGGRGGTVIEVYLPSIPAAWLELAATAEASVPALVPPAAVASVPACSAPVSPPVPAAATAQHAPVAAASLGTALVAAPDPRTRLSIAALYVLDGTVAGSPFRHAMVVQLADQLGCSPATLRRAMHQLADHPERTGIERQQRSDAGRKRVHVSQRFDAYAISVGIDPAALPAVADKVFRSVKGAMQHPASRVGWRRIRQVFPRRLTAILRSFGADCTLDRRMTEQLLPKTVFLQFIGHRDVATARCDAGRHYNDVQVPVIRTMEGGYPGQFFCIDATVGNINIMCDDGQLRSPKIVGAMDVYSGYAVLVVIRPAAKRGARQADGFKALALICRDLCVPDTLLRDNGKEFDRPDVYREIAAVVRHGLLPGVGPAREFDWVAKPYNARVKPIEALFRKLQAQGLAVIPGDHGGNFSDKKTHQQGRAPKPFPGTFEEFEDAVQALVRQHNDDTPWATEWRKGHTPRELIEAAAAVGKLPQVRLSDEEIGFLFSARDVRTVGKNGRIEFQGYVFFSPALASEAWLGRKVEVRWPLVGHAPDAPPVIHVVDRKTGLRICKVEQRKFGFRDLAGIDYRNQLDQEQRAMIAAKEAEADPFDIYEEALAQAMSLPDRGPIGARGTAIITPDGVAQPTAERPPPRELFVLDDPKRRRKAEADAAGKPRVGKLTFEQIAAEQSALRARRAG
jgi:hypothetical protein